MSGYDDGSSLRYFASTVLLILATGCVWHPVTWRAEGRGGRSVRDGLPIKAHSENYIPWDGESYENPLRVIRLNFHFMDDSVQSRNLTGAEAESFARKLVDQANRELADNQAMRLPLGNTTPVLDPLIRYEWVEEKQGHARIYFHNDNELYFLVNRGRDRNNYRRTVIEKYGRERDSILNVFVMPPHPDSLRSKTYGAPSTGIALGDAVKISGDFKNNSEAWRYSGMFNHEVGHILGLRHSWSNDGCEDTPRHTNCWNFTNNGSECDSLVSNNIMDSNADQDAFTPCQIGIMQRSLAMEDSKPRNFIRKDFCKSDAEKILEIEGTVSWEVEKDLASSVRIGQGAVLRIAARVSIPEGGSIYMERGSVLILESGALLHNACGLAWKGIVSREAHPDVRFVPGSRVRNVSDIEMRSR